ncbi:ATP-dependent nuclease [Lysinibacillus capsici]|uniref:ATP-dependent nuclease n=1 Tax=Lysinibacillus capsici TaxID=2115968 RepID=UPI002E22A8DC|nr:AAA family ATPase [Lysinibacillus capsici]
MDFKVTRYFRNLENLVESYPMIILSEDNWNDYGYYTLFHMHYFDEEKKHWEIGDVKILHEENEDSRSLIPTKFKNLKDEFCSLGQTLDYYEELLRLKNNKGIEILRALKDVVIDKDSYKKFKDNNGFSSSLIRFSEAEKALEKAIYLFEENEKQEENYKFTFKYQLKGANAPHEIPFDFTKSNLPNRINVLIGKNGTGKTQILSKIAAVVSGYERTKVKNFLPVKPLFGKIIAVSYSVFDEFDRPKKDGELFSYKYCGIRDKENKVISDNQIKDTLISNIELLHKKNRFDLWLNYMSEILGRDSFELLENYLEDGKINLSSGQSLILLTMTELITNIEDESLVLFDEPENHLHPNALSNLIKVLNEILEEFNSYAILSTHSSIVVQEIPSRYIKVIERNGTIPFIRDLHIESFGENLTTITNEVFDVKNSESNYKTILRRLSKNLRYNDILEMFGDNLSYNAVVFLNKIYKDK